MKKIILLIIFLSNICKAMEMAPELHPQPLLKQESKEEEPEKQILNSAFFPKGKGTAITKTFFYPNQYASNVSFTNGLRPFTTAQTMNIRKKMEDPIAVEFSSEKDDQEKSTYVDLGPLVNTILKNGYLEQNATMILDQFLNGTEPWKKDLRRKAAQNEQVFQLVKDMLCDDPDFLSSIAVNERVKKNACDSFLDAINEKKMNPKNKLSEANEYLWRHITQHPDIYAGSRNNQPPHKRHFYITMGLVGCACYVLGRMDIGKTALDRTRDFALEFIQNRLKSAPQN